MDGTETDRDKNVARDEVCAFSRRWLHFDPENPLPGEEPHEALRWVYRKRADELRCQKYRGMGLTILAAFAAGSYGFPNAWETVRWIIEHLTVR